MEIKSSGNKREFSTGSHRDMAVGKGRLDLLPADAVLKTLSILNKLNIEGGKKSCMLLSFSNAQEYMVSGDENKLCEAAAYALCAVGIDEADKIVEGYTIDDETDVFSTWSAGLMAVSKHYEAGAEKYGENNWKLGQPLHVLLDSGMRHNCKAIAGITDEPHFRATAWNYLCAMWMNQYLPEMKDIKFDN